MNTSWQVATGHPETTRAAVVVLDSGGNAFDAGIAAALAACVAEPVFCSLGGGGHALVRRTGHAPQLLDYFCQTPRRRRVDDLDFYPITGNFGPDTQEFHVGMASIAVPGVIAGLFALHERLGSLPFSTLAAPAASLAGHGVAITPVQAYSLRILEPIIRSTAAAAGLFGLKDRDAQLPSPGDVVRNRDFSGFLEELARAGPDLFYRGEAAARLTATAARDGGHLSLADLDGYRVRWRRPLSWRYRGRRIWSNPPPAFGGLMVALATHRLETHLDPDSKFGSLPHLRALCQAFEESEDLRQQLSRPELLASSRALLNAYRYLPAMDLAARRGTTHISIRDAAGNELSMTLTNGEGSGFVLPGTGVHLNNMLGEEDLNPGGFHGWPLNRRLASMMAPVMLEIGGDRMQLGTGGSNRIRTATAQVISNLVDFGMPPEEAVLAPRLHLESGKLAVEALEPGYPDESLAWLDARYPGMRRWPEANLYFGGVHVTHATFAMADPRRGGAAAGGQ